MWRCGPVPLPPVNELAARALTECGVISSHSQPSWSLSPDPADSFSRFCLSFSLRLPLTENYRVCVTAGSAASVSIHAPPSLSLLSLSPLLSLSLSRINRLFVFDSINGGDGGDHHSLYCLPHTANGLMQVNMHAVISWLSLLVLLHQNETLIGLI